MFLLVARKVLGQGNAHVDVPIAERGSTNALSTTVWTVTSCFFIRIELVARKWMSGIIRISSTHPVSHTRVVAVRSGGMEAMAEGFSMPIIAIKVTVGIHPVSHTSIVAVHSGGMEAMAERVFDADTNCDQGWVVTSHSKDLDPKRPGRGLSVLSVLTAASNAFVFAQIFKSVNCGKTRQEAYLDMYVFFGSGPLVSDLDFYFSPT
jgi:hypothetical protein